MNLISPASRDALLRAIDQATGPASQKGPAQRTDDLRDALRVHGGPTLPSEFELILGDLQTDPDSALTQIAGWLRGRVLADSGTSPRDPAIQAAPSVPPQGWCSNPAHGGYDHELNAKCVDPVTDADHTVRLMAEACRHDALSGVSQAPLDDDLFPLGGYGA